MSSLGPKQRVFTGLAEIAQALGHAHRLELLEHLGQGERSVEDLSARAGFTLATHSPHLQLRRPWRACPVPSRPATGSCSAARHSLSADVTASESTIGWPATMWWLDCSAR